MIVTPGSFYTFFFIYFLSCGHQLLPNRKTWTKATTRAISADHSNDTDPFVSFHASPFRRKSRCTICLFFYTEALAEDLVRYITGENNYTEEKIIADDSAFTIIRF